MATSEDSVRMNAVAGATIARTRRSAAYKRAVIGGAMLAAALWFSATVRADDAAGVNAQLNAMLKSVLQQAGFTGRIESTLEARLGREIDPALANLGQLLFFDRGGGLHDDNICAGCHSPAAGFGDTQSIAIGVQNNLVVGPDRTGPRNQRRSPSVVNTAFYPSLMWNGRFSAPSGDPFDNSMGFLFPPPEGATKFPQNDPLVKHLLVAQAHIPPTELVEVAGFTGTKGTISPRFDQFDDGKGSVVPPADGSGFRNEPIRQAVLARLNGNARYRQLFGALFPSVAAGGLIDFTMFGRAIAEFEFTLVYADAPIDQFARGQTNAMSSSEKRGALIFFGKGNCASCHAVGGDRRTKCSAISVCMWPACRRSPRNSASARAMSFSTAPAKMRISDWSRSPAIPMTATSSAVRRCATWRCSRRSSTTARLRASKTRFVIISTCTIRRSTTTRPTPVSTRTFATESGRSNRYWRASIHCWPRRSVFRNMNSRTFCISCATVCWTTARTARILSVDSERCAERSSDPALPRLSSRVELTPRSRNTSGLVGWRARLLRPVGARRCASCYAWAQPLAEFGEVLPLLWRWYESAKRMNAFITDASTPRDIRTCLDNPSARANGRFWANWTATLTGRNWPSADVR